MLFKHFFIDRRIILALLPAVLSACASYSQRMSDIHALLWQNQPRQALEHLQQHKPDDGAQVLYYLDMAMLSHQLGQYEQSNHYFELAKKKADVLYGVSVSDQLQAVSLNDETIEYQGEHYELLFIHGFSALNYLALGQVDEARVEILQAQEKMKAWGEPKQGSGGYYWILYLSAVIYEKLAEYDDALIASRKLWQLMKKNQAEIPVVLQQDLLRLARLNDDRQEYTKWKKEFAIEEAPYADKDAELVVFFFNGLAPVKKSHYLPTFSHDVGRNVNLALPYYPQDHNTISHARLHFGSITRLSTQLESVDRLARTALQENMPAMIARALLRQQVKKNFVDEMDKRNNGLVGLMARVATVATEHADTRSWTTLPHDIQLARVRLKPGEYHIQADLIDDRGNLVKSTLLEPVRLHSREIKIISFSVVNPYQWSKTK